VQTPTATVGAHHAPASTVRHTTPGTAPARLVPEAAPMTERAVTTRAQDTAAGARRRVSMEPVVPATAAITSAATAPARVASHAAVANSSRCVGQGSAPAVELSHRPLRVRGRDRSAERALALNDQHGHGPIAPRSRRLASAVASRTCPPFWVARRGRRLGGRYRCSRARCRSSPVATRHSRGRRPTCTLAVPPWQYRCQPAGSAPLGACPCTHAALYGVGSAARGSGHDYRSV
jgi:hypothetical protein